MKRRQPPDQMLHNNRLHLFLAGIFLPFSLAIVYFLAKDDPVLPPLLAWGLGILPPTILQIVRPIFPFRYADLTVPDTITVEQGRVLTFLKSRQGMWLAFSIGLMATALVGLAIIGGRVWSSKWYYTEGYRSLSLASQLRVSIMWGCTSAALMILALVPAHIAVSSRYALRHWAQLQARYQPWRLARLRPAFSFSADIRYYGAAPLPDPSPDLREITWREGLGIASSMIGPYFVVFGSLPLVHLLLDRKGFRLDVFLAVSLVPAFGAALIALGRYLHSQEAGKRGKGSGPGRPP